MARTNTPSPAEQKMIKRESDRKVQALKRYVNTMLAPIAEVATTSLADGAGGLVGWGADVGGRYLTRYLAKDPTSLAAKNPSYFSGALSAGIGGLAYVGNALVKGEPGDPFKIAPLRQGIRQGSAQLGFFGVDRMLTKALDLPKY